MSTTLRAARSISVAGTASSVAEPVNEEVRDGGWLASELERPRPHPRLWRRARDQDCGGSDEPERRSRDCGERETEIGVE